MERPRGPLLAFSPRRWMAAPLGLIGVPYRRERERCSWSLAPASFASNPTKPLATPPEDARGTGDRRTRTLRRTVLLAITNSFRETKPNIEQAGNRANLP